MRLLVGLLTVISLVLAACGGTASTSTVAPDGSQPAATTASAASTTSAKGILSDLSSALLTENDLPGWKFVPTSPTIPAPNDPCNAATAPATLISASAAEQTATLLGQGTNGPFFAEQLDRYQSAAGASNVLHGIRSALNCKEWHDSDSQGNQSTWRLSTFKPGSIGNGTVAVLASQSDASARVAVVYVQEGAYLVSIAYLSTSSPDQDIVSGMAKQADSKLKRLLG